MENPSIFFVDISSEDRYNDSISSESMSIVGADRGAFKTEILTVELLGQNNFVLLRVTDEITLSSLTSVDMPLQVGEIVGVQFDEGALHFFAPDTGSRL